MQSSLRAVLSDVDSGHEGQRKSCQFFRYLQTNVSPRVFEIKQEFFVQEKAESVYFPNQKFLPPEFFTPFFAVDAFVVQKNLKKYSNL